MNHLYKLRHQSKLSLSPSSLRDPAKRISSIRSYSATLYPDFIPIPSLSISTLSKFEQFYLSLPSPPSPTPSNNTQKNNQRVDIYVCTHGSRDCRCGELGEPLYESILKEVGKRDLSSGGGGGERVRVRRVSHIGGHKFAGNVLVYRRDGGGCDWLVPPFF